MIVLIMEAISNSEMSINFYEATRRSVPKTVFITLAAVRT